MIFFAACTKKDDAHVVKAGIESFELFPGKDLVSISPNEDRVDIRVPDTVTSGQGLTASFTLSAGATARVAGVDQVSGMTKNNFETDVTYDVSPADGTAQHRWTIRATNNDFTTAWGLGHFINLFGRQERVYDWYIDQSSTGKYASQNCGPAVVTMAAKWADPAFSGSVSNARSAYRPDGGWWYTDDADNYLKDCDVSHAIVPLSDSVSGTSDILVKALDQEQIILLCIDMNAIRQATDPAVRVDRFYQTSPNWGHFFIVKGYYKVDEALYFEVYDPYSFGQNNSDRTPKGKNRFYRSSDIGAATLHWWNYAIIIAGKGQTLSTETKARRVDASQIRRARGR